METMKVRKNILILTAENDDNDGIKLMVEYLEKHYTDFQPIVLTEKDYGGKRRAKIYNKLTKFGLQKTPRFIKRSGFIGNEFISPQKDKKISAVGEKFGKEIKRIYNAIVRFVPEIVLTTSPKTLYYAVGAKRKGALSCKIISFMPNFTFNKSYFNLRADGYIVENNDIKNELINNGVNEGNIAVLGLPFEEKKYIIKEIIATKELLGLNFNTTVLLSGGSTGNGQIYNIFKLLLDQGDYINILVNCGQNNDLFNKLVRIKDNEKANNVKIYTVGADISEMLTASDIVVTSYDHSLIYKSLLRGLPVITYSPMSRAEEKDFIYLEQKQLAYYAKDFNDTVIGIYKIIQQNLGASYKDAAKLRIKTNALMDICNYLTVPDGQPILHK